MFIFFTSCSSIKIKQPESIDVKSILADNKLENCFSATILNNFSSLTKEEVTYCGQHKEQVNYVIENFYKSPKNEIKCNLSAPYVFDGCKSEACGKFNPNVTVKTELMSSIINGNKIKILKPKESVEVLEFKILVKQIGKAVLREELLEPKLTEGSTLNFVSYGFEGSDTACIGKELVNINGNYRFLIPYNAENWVYVKTKDGSKGYISFWSLDYE